MVGIFINHDLVGVPQPIRNVSDLSRSDAPIKIVQKEARRSAARKPELVPGSESTRKVPMLPRTVQVEPGVVRPGIVSDPFISGVDMGRFGVLRLIGEMALRLRSSDLPAALWTAFILRTALRSAVLFRTGSGRRVATEPGRSASGRWAGVITALRRATLLLLSSPLLSDTQDCTQ